MCGTVHLLLSPAHALERNRPKILLNGWLGLRIPRPPQILCRASRWML